MRKRPVLRVKSFVVLYFWGFPPRFLAHFYFQESFSFLNKRSLCLFQTHVPGPLHCPQTLELEYLTCVSGPLWRVFQNSGLHQGPEIKGGVANHVDGKENSPLYSGLMPSSAWECQNKRRQQRQQSKWEGWRRQLKASEYMWLQTDPVTQHLREPIIQIL